MTGHTPTRIHIKNVLTEQGSMHLSNSEPGGNINIIDIEVSGLHFGSYLIEIAVLVGGKYHSSLIKPDEAWTYWCEKAEALHGISRSLLFKKGLPVSTVADELSEVLGNANRMIYSDADRWDEDWLSTLFYASGRKSTARLCSIFKLLSNEQKSKFHSIKDDLSLSGQYRTHRALDDVKIVEKAFALSTI